MSHNRATVGHLDGSDNKHFSAILQRDLLLFITGDILEWVKETHFAK